MKLLLLAALLGSGTPICLGGDRVVDQFDFEEAQLRPLTMPLAFEQVGEHGSGTDFPRFGEMSLTEDNPFSGRFAFRFDLQGRSMAARTLPGTISVLPLVDHRVSLQVRTADLERAGVRLVAWLTDEHGDIIPSSPSVSEVLRETKDDENTWQPLSLIIPGNDREATELVLELQLVQPDLQTGELNRARQTRPSLEDVAGTAVFDDIVVEQWPRLYLADASRIGIHTGNQPVLHLRVDDPAGCSPNWHIKVINSLGHLVHTDTGPVPPNGLDKTLTLPLDTCDWYAVHAQIDENGRVLLEDDLSLALLDEMTSMHPEPRIRLDLTGYESNDDQAELALDLLGHLGPGEAVIPAWHANVPFETSWPGTVNHVDELRRLDIKPMLALNWIPPEYQTVGPFDPKDAARFLARHPEALDETVNAAVIAWGDEASRWRIGRLEDNKDDMAAAMAALHDRLDGLVIDLDITGASSAPLHEQNDMTPRQRMQRSATELVEAWCDGQPTILVAAPWQQGTRGMEPTPTYPVLHTLIEAVSGRPEVATLPTGPGLQACLLEGRGRQPVVIAWKTSSDSMTAETGLRLPMNTAVARSHDALGNPVTIHPLQNDAIVPVGDLPVIVKGFKASTMRLPARCHIEPATLNASLQVHDHVLTLENTLPGSMQGHLIARAPEGITIRPSVIGLDLPPGGTLRMPIEIIVTTPLPAAPMAVNLEARLDTGRHIPITRWLDVAIPGLDVKWQLRNEPDNDDLIIDLEVSNRGIDARRLNATLGHEELEMTHPARLRIDGESSIQQTFRIPGGISTLAGNPVALLLEDPEGSGRLRDILLIPGQHRTVLVDDAMTSP
ncbi:MAG: hypothetical protein P8M22_09345 [Phycisphaerales bacterium]|nr:hypothetical protein [Phycisphaerales bacterium]